MAELQGFVRPRPIRVAFLIAEGENSGAMLDGAVADSYARWGGRFSLVVPVRDGQISAAYWSWLEAFDPDVIYSYVAMERLAVLELHERLNSEYLLHRVSRPEPRHDARDYRPQYRFDSLFSTSTVFRQARFERSQDDGPPLRILDVWWGQAPTRFFSDNFGTYVGSFGTSMFPVDASAAAGLKTVIDPEKLADRRNGFSQERDTLPSELAALSAYADRKATALSVASIIMAPKLEFHSGKWGGSFNLVVGDTFADRVMFWNARLLLPAWLDRDLCCLRIDPTTCDDDEFLEALGRFLKNRNPVNSGNGGQSQITIRSTSLDEQALGRIRDRILETRPWSPIRIEVVTNLDELVPTNAEIEQAREGSLYLDRMSPQPNWTRFLSSGETFRPPHVLPDHLADVPSGQAFALGHWAADLNLEREGLTPSFATENRWMLPKRWRMAGAFNARYIGGRQNDLPPRPRRGRHGVLSLFPSVSMSIDSITPPTDRSAINHALCREGAWGEDDLERGRIYPRPKVADTEPSSEARYLAGVVGLAGGLTSSIALFLHPFLRQVFKDLGGSPTPPADKVEPIANTLFKRVRAGTGQFDIADINERRALARLIVKAAASLRTPRTYLSFSVLKDRWQAYREEYWEKNPQPQRQDDGFDWDAHEAATLERTLIEMRQRQILFQGHAWSCKKCYHRNWVDIAVMSGTTTCEVCKTVQPMPIGFEWQFRPNEFLIESMRDRSTISLIWVLHSISSQSRSSFYFEGPTEFRFTRGAKGPDAEADLLLVSDGKAMLCEAKSSWAGVRPAEIDKLTELAKRLRPDIALLAVMEPGLQRDEDLDRARNELALEGIEFRVLTYPEHADDEPYLSAGD